MADPKITRRKISEYTPDPRNANKGTERGAYMIDTSLEQVGLARSIVAANDGTIPAGNKTLQAAMDAGIEDVIEVETDGNALVVVKRTDWPTVDSEQARQYAYLDNRASEVGLAWDAEQLLADMDAGMDLSGMFHDDELRELLAGEEGYGLPEDEPYSRKIEAPTYEPSNEKPPISALFDDSKTSALVAEIQASDDLSEDEKKFLSIAAQRHTVLNFSKIADYYAHADEPLQYLMENSALVIIDFDRAIELGFVQLTERIAEMVRDEYGE